MPAPSKRGSPDRHCIDINDENEVRNWSKSLGVTPERLIEGGSPQGRHISRPGAPVSAR